MKYGDFRDMSVWQLAFKLLVHIYKITKDFPKEKKFGLVSDMRRATNTITHNIAEGFGRFESKDKTRFYKISRGSCYELMSQLLVSFELSYLKDENQLNNLVNSSNDIVKELNFLIKSIESRVLK